MRQGHFSGTWDTRVYAIAQEPMNISRSTMVNYSHKPIKNVTVNKTKYCTNTVHISIWYSMTLLDHETMVCAVCLSIIFWIILNSNQTILLLLPTSVPLIYTMKYRACIKKFTKFCAFLLVIRSKCPKVVAPESRRAPSWVDAPKCVESMRPILFSATIRDWEAVYRTAVIAPQLLHTWTCRIAVRFMHFILNRFTIIICGHMYELLLNTPVEVVVLRTSRTILQHKGTSTSDTMAPCDAR